MARAAGHWLASERAEIAEKMGDQQAAKRGATSPKQRSGSYRTDRLRLFVLVAAGRHFGDNSGDINRLAVRKPRESLTFQTALAGTSAARRGAPSSFVAAVQYLLLLEYVSKLELAIQD